MKKNRRDIIEYLQDIEKEKDISSWRWSDIALWPVIKANLFFSWYAGTEESQEKPQIRIGASNFAEVRKIFSWLFRRRSKIEVVYAGFYAHRTLVNGKFVNKFFGPLEKCNYLEIEYGRKDRSKVYENSKNILFLEFFAPIIKLLRVIFNKKVTLNADIYDFLNAYDREASPLPKNFKEVLENKVHLVYIYSIFFSLLFRFLKVKEVYVLCYYNIQMLGLIHAANRLGIVTFDVQHGSQGPLHPMYYFNGLKSGSNFPNTLPSNFWCWDEPSASSLREWLPLKHGERVENRGNPWINYTLVHYGNNYRAAIDPTKNNILVTLQEPLLNETLLTVIEKLNRDRFVWWIRFHPRMMQKKEYWKNYFLKKSIRNIEIDKACDLPLPILLSSSFLHISRYSGSIIEGCVLGVRTFITDEIGILTFGHYVDNKKVFNVVNFEPDELLKLIESCCE